MARELQVWATVHHAIHFRGRRPTSVQVAIAVPSRAAAARAFGISSRYLNEYGSETSQESAVVAAMAAPGTIVWQVRENRDQWRPIGEADIVGNLPDPTPRRPVPRPPRARLETEMAAIRAAQVEAIGAALDHVRSTSDHLDGMLASEHREIAALLFERGVRVHPTRAT